MLTRSSKITMIRSFATLALLVLAAIAAAEDVAVQIERLSSPERAVRSEAERALLSGGTSILDQLPAVESISDPAARSAVLRIRKQLEVRLAEEQSGPTLITLAGTATLGDMAERLRQLSARNETTGGAGGMNVTRLYSFDFPPEALSKTVTLAAGERPFWQVLDDLAAQAGLWPDRVDNEGRFTFRERTPDDAAKRVAYHGPFRLAAGPVELRPIAGNDEQRLARVSVSLLVEPKLRPLFLAYAAENVRLATADGVTMDSFSTGAKYELPFGSGDPAMDLRFDFLAPATPLAEPLTLVAPLNVTAAAGSEWFRYKIGGNDPRERSQGGVSIRLREATLNADGTAEVELSVLYETGGPAFESHRIWVYHNRAYLSYEREGRLIEHDHEPGVSTIAQVNGGVVLRYRFEGLPPDAAPTFNYHAPTRIVRIPLQIELAGITVRKPELKRPTNHRE